MSLVQQGTHTAKNRNSGTTINVTAFHSPPMAMVI
jgi:hypothetical protein